VAIADLPVGADLGQSRSTSRVRVHRRTSTCTPARGKRRQYAGSAERSTEPEVMWSITARRVFGVIVPVRLRAERLGWIGNSTFASIIRTPAGSVTNRTALRTAP